jgi:transcription elongation factor Elf1
MARPAQYKCPMCRTTGTGGTTARTKLQVKYKKGKPYRIYCKNCGATGDPQSKRWLTKLGQDKKS